MFHRPNTVFSLLVPLLILLEEKTNSRFNIYIMFYMKNRCQSSLVNGLENVVSFGLIVTVLIYERKKTGHCQNVKV